MDETLIELTFSGVVNDASLEADIPYEGRVTFRLDTPRDRFDPTTGESIHVATDPDATFLLDGEPLDISEFEIRVGNNFDVGGSGFFVVDTLILTARSFEAGSNFSLSIGVAATDTGTITGFLLPPGPLVTADFDGSFMSSVFLPELSGEILRAETTAFDYLPVEPGTPIGAGISVEDARLVAYLYEAGLNRNGDFDIDGLNFWIDEVEAGATRTALAGAFLRSDEFEASFGDPDGLSDRDLVEVLYANVLDREGEEAGVDFWTDRVSSGEIGREELLIAFAQSPENVLASPEVETLTEVVGGTWDFV